MSAKMQRREFITLVGAAAACRSRRARRSPISSGESAS